MGTFGDKLNEIVRNTQSTLFSQGELAQLTYQAIDAYEKQIKSLDSKKIKISYPIGYSPSKKTILSEYEYTKENLIKRYDFLLLNQLPINGMYQLVTLTEGMFGDILRTVIIKYPKKINAKKKINMGDVLKFDSIEEIKNNIADTILNELAYQSPKDFSDDFNNITSINMIETPIFHKYIELKATRDIYIHNRGIANETYVSKSDTHARVKSNQFLPVDLQYFFESYECCLQLCEFLEERLHDKWPSIKYESEKNKKQTIKT